VTPRRPAPPRQWRVHVGAHKTATTHLQDTLAARRTALQALGVDYLTREALRGLRLPVAAEGRFAWRRRLGWPLRRRLESRIAPLRSGPACVALSEEDLLGSCAELLDWPFYPRAGRRLAAFAALAGHAEVEIFLSVRGFAGVLPSAYVQVLRWRAVPGGFAPIRAAALARPPSWAELARRLARALPQARLTVWRAEDYRAHEAAVLSRFCGVAVPAGEALPPPERTRSPPAGVVAALEGLDPGLVGHGPRAAALARTGPAPARGAAFMPFSEAERALLSEAYDADLARLAREMPGVLLVPGAGAGR